MNLSPLGSATSPNSSADQLNAGLFYLLELALQVAPMRHPEARAHMPYRPVATTRSLCENQSLGLPTDLGRIF
jgi:hypothetical protein